MDLRESLNAISDVIVNRPYPLREFDQIYMKAADMLIQAEHVGKWLHGRDVIFVGDGDALSLCLVHLHAQGQLDKAPRSVHIVDFDERTLNAAQRFAERYGYTDRISTTLYNVADPLPDTHIQHFGAFYTNPPFGGSNGGASAIAFLLRGIEASKDDSVCCAVLADYEALHWCHEVLRVAQQTLLEANFHIAEMVPSFHRYHLDDEPDLTSCSLIARRLQCEGSQAATSRPLPDETRRNFYGRGASLGIHYVRDHTNGGKLGPWGHEMEPY